MNIRPIALALIVLASAAILAPAPVRAQQTADREPGALVGRVLEDGRPASGVRVLAVSAGHSETTGGDGRFRMEPVAPGVHRLVVVHPEFGTDSARATVASGTTTGVTLRYGAEGELKPTLHLGGLPDYDAAGAGGEAATGRSRILGELIGRDTSDPIPAASVRLPDLDRQTRTSEEGRFVFDSLPAGIYTVRVDHVRYGTQTAEVRVPRSRTVDAEIRLAPEAIEVEPIQVSVDVRSPGLASADYYQRREWGEKTGYGHFLEGEDLDRGNRLSDVLGTVPRLKIGNFGRQLSSGGHFPYFPRHRDFSGPCLPAIYLDGQKIVGSGPAREVTLQFGPRGINGLVNLSEVAAVEVYPSPASTAGEFQGADSSCGVVVLWTRRGKR